MVSGNIPTRLGNAHPSIVPYSAFAASDDSLIIAVGNDGQFKRMANTIGLAHLGEDERYATNAARVANREELVPLLQESGARCAQK